MTLWHVPKVAAFMMAITFILPGVLLPNLLKDGGLPMPRMHPHTGPPRLVDVFFIGPLEPLLPRDRSA